MTSSNPVPSPSNEPRRDGHKHFVSRPTKPSSAPSRPFTGFPSGNRPHHSKDKPQPVGTPFSPRPQQPAAPAPVQPVAQDKFLRPKMNVPTVHGLVLAPKPAAAPAPVPAPSAPAVTVSGAPAAVPVTRFDQLDLLHDIQRALADEKYETPTPIQARAIPHILAGRDLIGCAQTGTGKTAAFAIPVLQALTKTAPSDARGVRPIRCLVLTPTRELAIQIQESFATYGRHLKNIRTAVVFGGVGQGQQVDKLRAGVDVLIATPGRLLDLMSQGYVRLQNISTFILDEADRMLDMGFINDVRKIVAKVPTKRQTLFFSATMPPAIRQLAATLLTNPVTVEVTPVSSTAEKISQSLYFVAKENKIILLREILAGFRGKQALVFTRTKHGADKLVKQLTDGHIPAQAIHGNKSQNARQRALRDFKEGRLAVLVATDIAARGIDVDGLSLVVNYEISNEAETYVHRIGRTGRAGAAGVSVSLCDCQERGYIRSIEKLIGKKIPVVEEHKYVDRSPERAPDPIGGGNRGGRGGFRSGQTRHPGHAGNSGHTGPRPAGGGHRPHGGGGKTFRR